MNTELIIWPSEMTKIDLNFFCHFFKLFHESKVEILY